MHRDEWVNRLFQSIDDRDLETFLSFLSEDVFFRFGNAEPAKGKEAVGAGVGGFFDSIKTLRHEVIENWEEGDAIICHGIVTYTRHDASTLSVPFANVFKIGGDFVKEYLIFVDVSELYNPA